MQIVYISIIAAMATTMNAMPHKAKLALRSPLPPPSRDNGAWAVVIPASGPGSSGLEDGLAVEAWSGGWPKPTISAAASAPVWSQPTPSASPAPPPDSSSVSTVQSQTWTTAKPSTPPTPSSSPSPSTETHTGDITHYAAGLGSCGVTNTDADPIVALAADMMTPSDGDNPNENPLCGRSITISYGGQTAIARIEDTCPGCEGVGLDLTPSLFEVFAPLGVGRVGGVEWWFN